LAQEDPERKEIFVFVNQGGIGRLDQNLEDITSLESGILIRGPGSIATLDLLGDKQKSPLSKNRLVPNGREAAGYTFGYNRSLLAQRVSQVQYLIEYIEREYPDRKIYLVADKKCSPVAAVAFATSKSKSLAGLTADLNGFRFSNITSFRDPNFLPGGAKYFDVEGMLALKADRMIYLGGEKEDSMPFLKRAFEAAGNLKNLVITNERFFDMEK
jgi:hypothetical protein